MPENTAGAPVRLETPGLKPHEFKEIQRLAHEKFGLELREGKEELVSARLGKILRKGGFRSFEEYYRHVAGDPSGEALVQLIDALTTNFTSFLREPAHFDYLIHQVLPGWRNRSEVRIWSAACSSGEEPCTLAFLLLDQLSGPGAPSIRILATDISTRALETAQRGVYAEDRFREMPPGMMSKYLLRGHGNSQGYYKVKPEVRRLIEFERLNLIEPFRFGALFSLILCRNVMIYFDKPTQSKVVEKLAACLEPGGHLFVGHSESLTGRTAGLSYVCPAVYRKVSADSFPTDHGRTRR